MYTILFVCCATRAVNIEPAEDALTKSCKQAFQRHCARYGCPEHVYSDNGKNFVGLHNELQTQYGLWTEAAASLGHDYPTISWRFAPPYSPRWNGHVEIMVKLFKNNFKSLLEFPSILMNSDEFSTLCVIASGFLNRRPLVQVGAGMDSEVLTPAHFLLTGNPNVGFQHRLPEAASLAQRKQELDQVSQLLWQRLQTEYILAKARFTKKTSHLRDSL